MKYPSDAFWRAALKSRKHVSNDVHNPALLLLCVAEEVDYMCVKYAIGGESSTISAARLNRYYNLWMVNAHE